MAEKLKTSEASEQPAVHPTRLKGAEYAFSLWRLAVPSETSIEDLKRSAFYAHIAQHLRNGDVIQVMPDNRAYFAELLVVDAGAQYAKVALLREVKLEALQAGASSAFPGYSIEYAGDHERWRIIREADRKVLKAHQASQADAFTWLTNHLKALAA
jgi:hypothetical protein